MKWQKRYRKQTGLISQSPTFFKRVNFLRIFGKFYRYSNTRCDHVFFSTVNSFTIHQRSCTDKEEIGKRFGVQGLSIMYACPMPPSPCSYVYQLHVLASIFGNLYIYSNTRCALTISLIFINPTLQLINTFAMRWKYLNHIVSNNQNPPKWFHYYLFSIKYTFSRTCSELINYLILINFAIIQLVLCNDTVKAEHSHVVYFRLYNQIIRFQNLKIFFIELIIMGQFEQN